MGHNLVVPLNHLHGQNDYIVNGMVLKERPSHPVGLGGGNSSYGVHTLYHHTKNSIKHTNLIYHLVLIVIGDLDVAGDPLLPPQIR
ncbi:MAG: hypothetical protein DRN55_07620 [Thermoplasmata archaeon]|nr:MAG: hypothetical protein DRN55_07620 [Thermoplasmata archaeon]